MGIDVINAMNDTYKDFSILFLTCLILLANSIKEKDTI